MKKFANLFINIGVILLCVAFIVLAFNIFQSYRAVENSNSVITQMEEKINLLKNDEAIGESSDTTDLIIDGNKYIGYISITSLDLKLPVMENWDYNKLKISPCRYYGSPQQENLVIMAHNYSGHFGKISQLSVDDEIVFTDESGNTNRYLVTAKDILSPYSTEDVIESGSPLVLFTCTYGGQNRVAIYCDKKS